MSRVTASTMRTFRYVASILGVLLVGAVVSHDVAMARMTHADPGTTGPSHPTAHDLRQHHAPSEVPIGEACDVGDRGVLIPASGRASGPQSAVLSNINAFPVFSEPAPSFAFRVDSFYPPDVRRAFLQVFRN